MANRAGFHKESAYDLTEREIEILKLVADGLTRDEIGLELKISAETVKAHVKHILNKLSARNAPQAVSRGFITGLLVVPNEGS